MEARLDLADLNGDNGFVINGVDADDRFGLSVSSAGDVNNDGIDDLIIGAPWADPGGVGEAGETYVVFGGTSVGASGSLDPATFDGSTGFVLTGRGGGDMSGITVSTAGDVNGDDIDDLIIGAPVAAPGGIGQAGESYVVFGGSTVGSTGSLDLSSLDGTNGFVLSGLNGDDQSGRSVSSAGDVNGDGVADLVIGAFGADPGGTSAAGETYVVFGGASVGASGGLDLSSLDGSDGFVLTGIDLDDESGYSVSSAGDVNDDGVVDLIIGAYGADPGGKSAAGETYVVFGGVSVGASGGLDLSSLDGTNGFVLNGLNGDDQSGRSVSSAGDVNGDGVTDLVIGAFGADPDGKSAAGETYVVFGGSSIGASGGLDLSSLDGSNGFVLTGIDTGDYSGISVACLGDINEDSVDDLIVGASEANPNDKEASGEVYVVFGGTSIGTGGRLDLSTLDGGNGVIINGASSYDNLGFSVSSAGDVNGDSVPDLLIGAPGAHPSSSGAGKAYTIIGGQSLADWIGGTNGGGGADGGGADGGGADGGGADGAILRFGSVSLTLRGIAARDITSDWVV